MSQSGHGRDALHGYHAAPAHHANLPNSQYTRKTQSLGDTSGVTAPGHGNASQPPSQYSRNVIPGLGLGFSSNNPAQQGSWVMQPSGSWYSAPQPSRTLEPSSSQKSDVDKPMEDISGGGGDNVSEEGEISEGVDGDIYQPKEPLGHAINMGTRAWPRGSGEQGNTSFATRGRGALSNNPYTSSQAAGAAACHTGPANMTRERSGSYSPHLSPREINSAGALHISPGQHHNQDNNGGAVKSPTARAVSTNDVLDPSGALNADRGLVVPPPENVVEMAKQKARDAILQLWPLNVRYGDYIKEGIDGAILGRLFKDLELDFEESVGAPENPKAPDVAMTEAPAPTKEQDKITGSPQQPVPSEPANEETRKAVDKSEERKDRIARLLAAKGSKTTTGAPAPAPPTANAPTVASVKVAQPSQKAQSEKSKLLHQKMEALRKSRENLARSRSQQHPPDNANLADADTEKTSTPDDVAANLNAGEDSDSLPGSSNKLSGSGKPSPSIPGLFLSTTPQPSQRSDSMSQQRQPTPSSADPSAKPTPRPFGQTESRPLLINVSDDEDDAEMDIDSPVRRSSTDRPDALSQKTAALRESSSATNNLVPPRRELTPMSAATPSRNQGHSNGGENLASMNKKIEAMKRKIAEAEARKRTKLSRQVSPAMSQQNDSSRNGSVEAAGMPSDFGASALTPNRRCTPLKEQSTEAAPAAVPHERSSPLPESDRGPSTARQNHPVTASERLPLIEARRREQLIRLKSLQSQIARIEQEIAEGMQEEEKIKEHLVVPDSDSDEPEAAPLTAVSSEREPLDAAQHGSVKSASHSPIIADENTIRTGATSAIITRQDAVETPQDAADSRQDNDGAGELVDAGQTAMMVDETDESAVRPERDEQGSNEEPEQDVMMKDMETDAGEDSEGDYEPPDADTSADQDLSASASGPAPPAVLDGLPPAPEGADADCPASAASAQLTSEGEAETTAEIRAGNEALPKPLVKRGKGKQSEAARGRFAPYDSPLHYFRAYRFHPEFGKCVGGGLRSLTYSNRIDVQKQVCPDELAGQQCPRGSQCDYQHFESMKAPDDQILLQLGASSHYQEKQRQEYNAGLRSLLTDFRSRKVKDFNTISQGIIDYRTQFLGDSSKILPLDGVAI